MDYEKFLEMGKVPDWDNERKAFFYIIGNSSELSERINKIYDFEANGLRIYENLENESGIFTGEEGFYQMSSTAQRLLRVAVALYNGRECDLFNTFGYINQETYFIVSRAIEIRFDFLSSFQYQFERKKMLEAEKYKKQILEILYENKDDLKKINISKICRILEINRTTFYNYKLDEFYKDVTKTRPIYIE